MFLKLDLNILNTRQKASIFVPCSSFQHYKVGGEHYLPEKDMVLGLIMFHLLH